MGTMLKDHETQRRVYLALEDTAHHFTSQDLLKIYEAAGQVHGMVRIRQGSWKVLVGVPEIDCQKLTKELLAMGYKCAGHDEKISEVSTFLLGRIAI